MRTSPSALRFLFFLVFCMSASARAQQGGVSSNPPGSNAATPSSNDPKPLPWKFLAGPMGLLGPDWAAELKEFGKPEKWNCRAEKNCAPEEVKRLVRETIGIDLDRANPTYVVIHVVDSNSGTSSNVADWWYLYRSKDKKWSFQEFTAQRIYGSPGVLFVFVHLNAKGILEANLTPEEQSALKANSALKNGKILCEQDTKKRLQWLGNGAIVQDYAKVRYDSAVVKRTPANVANLLDILKILGFGAQGAAACEEKATATLQLWGAGRIEGIGLPSDVSIAGYAAGKDDAIKDEDRSKIQIGSVGAFNDEQLYWWDASIGIPVHKIKDLQYSESDNTVVAAHVDKQSAYAMFNLMLHPVDLSDPKSNVWPRLLAGFPLSSSPWDSLFAGGGIGIPWKPVQNFQFFAGATFSRNKQPTTLAAGSTATNAQLQNDLRIKFTPKLTFGINVPVKSVLDKLLK